MKKKIQSKLLCIYWLRKNTKTINRVVKYCFIVEMNFFFVFFCFLAYLSYLLFFKIIHNESHIYYTSNYII